MCLFVDWENVSYFPRGLDDRISVLRSHRVNGTRLGGLDVIASPRLNRLERFRATGHSTRNEPFFCKPQFFPRSTYIEV